MTKQIIGLIIFLSAIISVQGEDLSLMQHSIHIVTGKFFETETDIEVPGHEPLQLQRMYSLQMRKFTPLANGWQFNVPDIGKGEIPRRKFFPPEGYQYRYDYDSQKRLSRVELVNTKDKKILSSLAITYSNEGCTVTGSNGHSVTYGLMGDGLMGDQLKSVERENGYRCEYEYMQHPFERELLITERRERNGVWSRFVYFGKEDYPAMQQQNRFKTGKVKAFYQSCNEGENFSLICAFDYEPGLTSVRDAQQVLTKYRYDTHGAIYRIETWIPGTCGDELYKAQEFVWEGTHLIRKTTLDGLGNIALQQSWDYNDQGDLVSETLEGVLTKAYAGLETFCKRYVYDGNHLLIEEQEEEGPTFRYRYSGNRLLGQSICVADQIVKRMFYAYDAQGNVVCTWIDDGSSADENDLTDVCERVFERIKTRDLFGNVLEEEKGSLDLSTQEEVVVESIVRVFDSKGNLLRQTVRHPLTGEETWVEHTYDEKGTLIATKTSDHQMTVFSKAEKRIYHLEKESILTYSKKGELLSEETYQNGDKIDGKYYFQEGNERSTMDLGGNRSTSVVDCLGRTIEEVSPPVFAEGARTRFAYDIFDRAISHTDPLGSSIKTVYNVRGKPLLYLYPDGSFEEMQYTLSGRLKKERFKNGTYKTYAYDALGRVISKDFYGSDDQLIKWTRYTYERSLLLKEKYSGGIIITHRYDGLGRKVESTAFPTGRKMTYEYSPQDKKETPPSEEEPLKEWVENGRGQIVLQETKIQGDVKRVILYDPLKRMQKVSSYSLDGSLISIAHFRHDLRGNKIKEWLEIQGKDGLKTALCNAWEYDACGHLIKSKEGFGFPEEQSETYHYNDLDQLISSTKPDGTVLSYQYDPAGRLARLASSDFTLDYELTYDAEGQVSKIEDRIHHLNHERNYNPEGQLLEETLPSGLKIQNRFDSLGRRSELILPDLSKIKYQTSSILRESPSGDSLYSYTYLERDSQGKTLRASLIGNLGEVSFERSSKGRCISTISPYFSETAQLDSQGRIVQLDETTFSYDSSSQLKSEKHSFDALGNLQTKDGRTFHSNSLNQLFSEELLAYDLNGNLIRKGDLHLTYDPLNRLTQVEKEGEVIHSYIYDVFHRRVIDSSDAEHPYFLYDGNWEMGSCDREGKIHELRVFEPDARLDHGPCIAFELQGSLFAPLYNLTGSVAALVAVETKQVVEEYTYTPFGECNATGSFNPLNPWRFANKRCDFQTGLTHFGRRDYDPSLCRFLSKDPLGFADGINPYAYLHNNPLNARDLFGLKSISEQWDDFVHKFSVSVKSFFTSLKNMIATAYDYIIHHIIGAGFLLLLGHYKPGPVTGSYGQGEVNGKVRITFINGILTAYNDLIDSVRGLSESHGNVNIHYVFRYTKGWLADFFSSFLVQIGFISPDAHQLAAEWRKLIDEMGGTKGGGKIIHYAHSIGCLETLRALSLMTSDEKAMIEVYGFGSPTFTVKDPYAKVRHFASLRDGVCLLDLASFIKACMGKLEHVILVGTLMGAPFVDHLFLCQTYQDIWKSMGRTFTDWYGSLQ